MNTKTKNAVLFLRIGIAFVFLYAAGSSFINPTSWVGYFPPFLTKVIDSNVLLPAFSLFEVILGLWVLSGIKLFYSSIVSSLALFGIIIANYNIMDIVFRDVGLMFASFSLIFLSLKEKE